MGLSTRYDVRHYKLAVCVAVLATAAAGSSGCGDATPKPDASKMATISGSVTIEGKAVAAETHVVFFNKDKAATAAGKTDSLGKFSLTEADARIGIPAGRYEVMIRPPDPPPMKIDSDDYKKMMSGAVAPADGVAPKPVQRTSEIPSRFQDFLTSKLALEVKTGPNTFDIDLAKIAE